MRNWKLLTVVTDGERLEIDGANVWEYRWNPLNEPDTEVPHPNYPKQRHKLSPYYVEVGSQKLLFAAGELSNCVWCFYVAA